MTFTVHIPTKVVAVIGGLVTAMLGALAATLLPTPLMGYLGGKAVYEPTSLTTYFATAVAALAVYLVALMLARRHAPSATTVGA
jgi:hypothetical protein